MAVLNINPSTFVEWWAQAQKQVPNWAKRGINTRKDGELLERRARELAGLDEGISAWRKDLETFHDAEPDAPFPAPNAVPEGAQPNEAMLPSPAQYLAWWDKYGPSALTWGSRGQDTVRHGELLKHYAKDDVLSFDTELPAFMDAEPNMPPIELYDETGAQATEPT